MKTAIVIGASSEFVYAIDVARKRGYHVIAFDGNPQADSPGADGTCGVSRRNAFSGCLVFSAGS